MIKFKLTKDFEDRFKKFISSDIFKKQSNYSKSSYWEYHAGKINYKISKSILELSGDSGNYIPDKKNSFEYFKRSLKTFIKDFLGLDSRGPDSYFFLKYSKALNKIMNEKRVPGYQQVNFDEQKIITKNYGECKKIFPFDYAITDHIIRSYYYINILNSYINFNKKLSIVEIGAGNGNLLSLIKKHLESKCIIDIDLPETLILAIPYLNRLFPNAKILLPNEVNSEIDDDILAQYDFIFLTPSQLKFVKENTIDLAINTSSFHEMEKTQIAEYIQFIQKVCKNHSFFFNTNSVEKIPHDGEKKDLIFKKTLPNRFFEYPFFNNEILIYQICRFTNFVQHIPFYLRLEKIIK